MHPVHRPANERGRWRGNPKCCRTTKTTDRLAAEMCSSMADQINPTADFSNQALIQDETLLAVILVLEQGWPAGPTFLNALNTLIEAVVIHDVVYFDPHHQFRREHTSNASVPGVLKNSDFVKLLVQESAIRLFPETPVIDAFFVAQGRNYSFAQFLADFHWSRDSFVYADPTDEADRLNAYVDVVSKAPLLLEPRKWVPNSIKLESGDELKLVEGQQLSAMILEKQLSLGEGDLLFIEGLNYKAKAFLDLAQNVGLHLHPFYLSLPHQIGAIRQNNSRAMELFRQLEEGVKALPEQKDSVGESQFQRSPIPALTEVVLGRCKDSPRSIALELLELRNVHRKFRDYLTTYERNWNLAHTKRERWKLKLEVDNAVKMLLEKERRPGTRVIYTLWDFIKEPSKIVKTIGDKVVKRGQDKYVVGRVKGLHDFWNDLASSPPSDVVNLQFNRLFPRRSDEQTWEAGRKLAAAINAGFTRSA